MTNAEYIAHYLESRGVTHVYELVGGMITFLLDAMHQHSRIRIVSMHHEQGAAFAAEGWARVRGIPGVALATSGPGATNLLTAVGSCYFDSVPAVFITGQVNRHEQKGMRAIRQLGFQETDIVSMVARITKAAWLVNDPDTLPHILDEAFRVASNGRPGPVLIDIPMDVQRYNLAPEIRVPPPVAMEVAFDHKFVDEFTVHLESSLCNARRPVIIAGGGIRSGRAADSFRDFVEHTKIPVIHSLLGVDVLPFGHPQRIGLIGSYGNRWANLAFSKSDLVLVLGSRLDIRQTGSDVEGFQSGRLFFHVDCESGEINNRLHGCEALVADIGAFLTFARGRISKDAGSRPDWESEWRNLRAEWPDVNELRGTSGINPNAFLHLLSQTTRFASCYITDVGQHQMWAAQSMELQSDQRFLTSGGMGAMGFALPVSIGAAFATGPCVVIAGDGGFQLNIQELQTIVRNRLPVKIVVLNNHCHGMVRQFQESYFKGRYQSTLWGYDAPNFVKVAEAYGLPSAAVDNNSQVAVGLAQLSADSTQPFLLEVRLDTMTNAYPKLAFGRTFGEMEPMVKPLDMEST